MRGPSEAEISILSCRDHQEDGVAHQCQRAEEAADQQPQHSESAGKMLLPSDNMSLITAFLAVFYDLIHPYLL